MSFTLLQVGGTLRSLNPQGGYSPALTLPNGVQLATNRVPRFATFRNFVIVVNTPTRPLSVDDKGIVRLLTPSPPGTAVALTSPNSGTLTGSYKALETFVELDSLGNVISESDYSPVMQSYVTITNKKLLATFQLSSEQIDAIRLYRTATNGTSYFQWAQIPGNATNTFESDLPDASLGLVATPPRGSAPDLTLITEWNGRLWGVDRVDVDDLRYTEAGTMYAWSALNTLPIPHVGEDRFGVTALAPRRNVLGVGRQNRIAQVIGSTTADIRPVGVSEHCGFLSQESVQIFQDNVFFLWHDGIYQWNSDGIVCLSDQAGVRSWFATDDFFNRGMFSLAFSVFDHVNLTYRLFLTQAGSTTQWLYVEYSLRTGKFYGPHLTQAFTPSCAVNVRGTNDQIYPMVGCLEGYLSQDSQHRTDWGLLGVPMKVVMRSHIAGDANMEKYFGQVEVHTEPEDGGTLTVTPYVGDLKLVNAQNSSVAAEPFPHDLTQERELLDRVGTGKAATLVFENSEVGRKVTIYGYEIDPVNITGRR